MSFTKPINPQRQRENEAKEKKKKNEATNIKL